MDIIQCLVKIHPGWKGAVWENKYEGIKPDKLEKRPIPTIEELEAVWPQVQADLLRVIEENILEPKIQAELRAMAIERLQTKGEIIEVPTK